MTTRKAIALVGGYLQEINTPTDKLDFAGNTTSDLTEGTRLYYTDVRSRNAVSSGTSGTGYGALSYNSTTGVFTYTVVSSSDIRGNLSVTGGSGLTYNSSTGAFGTSAIPNSQLANSAVTVGTTSISLGNSSTTLAGLTSVTSTAYSVGTAGAANSIALNSTGIVFEGATANAFATTLNVVDPTANRTLNLPDSSGTIPLLTSFSAGNSGTGYGSLSYSSATGTFTYTVVSSADIWSNFSAGNTGTGYGNLAYNSTTGAFTYTVVTSSDIRGNFSVAVGSGLTYNSFTGAFGTSSIPNSQLANSAITLGSTSVSLGSTATSIAGLTSVTATTVNAGTGGTVLSGATSGTTTIIASATASGTLTLPAATSTLAALGVAQSFTAGQRGAISVLTDGATITADFAVANNFSVTLGGNRTLANPSNQTAGQAGIIVITQDGTGSRTLAYGANWKFPSGTAPTLTTTASAVDVLVYYVESASRITARLISDVK